MADNYLNKTVLRYFYNRLKTIFTNKTDFDALSDKVDEIVAEGGEPNIIESISVNGSSQTITDKNVDITIPVNTSDLTNDGDGNSNFATEEYVGLNGGKIDVIKVNDVTQTITNKEVNINLSSYAEKTDLPSKTSELTNDSDFLNTTQVQALIDSELADITGIDFQVVDTLPTTGTKGTIYLMHKSGASDDIYDEFIWVEPTGQTAHYEKIGTTDIDLSEYWSKDELTAITTAEIDEIVV